VFRPPSACFVCFSIQVDGRSRSARPVRSGLVPLRAAAPWLRRGAFAALRGQDGAVVGGPLAGGRDPAGEGGGRGVGPRGPPRADGPRRRSHEEPGIRNMSRGGQLNINKPPKHIGVPS